MPYVGGGYIPDNNDHARVSLRPCAMANTETEISLCRRCFDIVELETTIHPLATLTFGQIGLS